MKCPRCNLPIDEHTAGRETDACVAEAVMGWEWRYAFGGDKYWFPGAVQVSQWNPSENIADAWQVEELVADNGLKLEYARALSSLMLGRTHTGIMSHEWMLIHASPLDRCKAALML